MNSLSLSFWIHVFFEFTLNSLSSLFTMNKLWIHFSNLKWFTYLFFKFIRNPLSFCKIATNSLFISQIQFLFRKFTFNSLSIKRIYYLRLFFHYRSTSFISYSISIQRNKTIHSYRNYFLSDSECPQTEDPIGILVAPNKFAKK